MRPDGRVWKAIARSMLAAVLVIGMVSACRPNPQGPDAADTIATVVAGTQRAQALASLVAATLEVPEPSSTPRPPQPTATRAVTLPPAPENDCPDSKPGKLLYIDPAEGYCLLYPEDFTAQQASPGTNLFLGPALEDGVELVRAVVSIQKKEQTNGRTLDEIALEGWSESRNPYRQYNIRLGGQDALAAEGLETDENDWKTMQVVFIHNNWVYVMVLSPVEDREPFSRATPYILEFWDTFQTSFMFYQ